MKKNKNLDSTEDLVKYIKAVLESIKDIKDDVVVYIMGGRYFFDKTVVFDDGEMIYKDKSITSSSVDKSVQCGTYAMDAGFGAMNFPMIILNVTSVMLRVDPENADLYNKRADECVEDIFKYHVKKDLGCTLESVSLDGTPRLNVTEGRVVNPGHDIECSWFLMERANQTGDKELHAKAVEIFDMAFQKGWDKEFGGILYFFDCLGNPPEAYEHDMKLWWPHNEAIIASLKLYKEFGDEKYLKWFEKITDYAFKHFSDPEFGEWFGYLRRDGKPTEPPCKGCSFKGPFHVMRCLTNVLAMFDDKMGV